MNADWPELTDYWGAKVEVAQAHLPYTFMGRSPRWSVVVSAPDMRAAAGCAVLTPTLELVRSVLIADIALPDRRYLVASRLLRDEPAPESVLVPYGLSDEGGLVAHQLRYVWRHGQAVSAGADGLEQAELMQQVLTHAMAKASLPAINQVVGLAVALRGLMAYGCEPSVVPLDP